MSKVQVPEMCPCCGAKLTERNPETDDVYESWEYDCDLQLAHFESGKLYVAEDCGNATDRVIDKLNLEHEQAALTSKERNDGKMLMPGIDEYMDDNGQ